MKRLRAWIAGLPPSVTVFVRLFAFFVLPFVLVSLFFLREQHDRIRVQLHERSLMQMRLVALGIENGIKDGARLESANPLLIARGLTVSLDTGAIPLAVRSIAHEWFASSKQKAFLYFFRAEDEDRLLYLHRRETGYDYYVFRARFLEDYFLTTPSLEPTDSLFLFNSDGTPAMSNLIEADFQIPKVWQEYLQSNEVAFDSVRTVKVGQRDFLVMGAPLIGLPVTGLLAKPADVAFLSLTRALYANGALLFVVFVASLFLSRYFARYEVRLIEAREDALRAARARAEFLSTMSHEIRTPLNAVLGASELLGETPLDSTQAGYVAMFRRAGRLLLELINDILDYARVESGKITIETVEFDPRGLVEETCELMHHYRRDQAVELLGHVGDDVPARLIGDPRHLRQVLSNLVSNGLKFTKRGTVEIVIRAAGKGEPTEDGGPSVEHIRFGVRDSGPGIPADKQRLVFESFGRIGENDQVAKGTGLGLAISAGLVRAMGGEIRLESQVGVGTEFYFVLPLAVPVTPAEARPSPVVVGEPPVRVDRDQAAERSLSVLLAEDNEDNRVLLSAFLKSMGNLRLETVEDGQQAVERVRAQDYDVVLMDMSMPVLDGFAATRKIREDEASVGRSPVPIIALTAYTMSEEVERCFAAGCSAYLSKPIGKQALVEAVRNAAALSVGAPSGP